MGKLIHIRVDDDVRDGLEAAARADGRKVNSLVAWILRMFVEKKLRPAAPPPSEQERP